MSEKRSKTPAKKNVKTVKNDKVVSKKLSIRQRLHERISGLLTRRPHRSFKQTRRRDYARSLKLPGYWAFTAQVWKYIWYRRKTFFLLSLVYAVITAAFVGIASQSTYLQFTDSLRESGSKFFGGEWSEVGQAALLLGSGMIGSLSTAPSDTERAVALVAGLLMWLTTVWLLRAFMAGKKPRLRDGLYNAGSPIVGTFLVFLVLLVQLLPLAIAFMAFAAASSTGLIDQGVESMVFWAVEILLIILSLYWLASTFFAMVIVTLPGMYPMQALKTAGDLVIGRRLRIFLRFIWVFALTFVLWVVIMVPLILFDGWLKGVWPAISWLPLVPVLLLAVASVSLMWVASYTYMLYRKVVDDGSAPA